MPLSKWALPRLASPRTATGRRSLRTAVWSALVLLCLAGAAQAQEQDFAIDRVGAQPIDADLTLPGERGEIAVSVVASYDSRADAPETVTLEVEAVTALNGFESRLQLGREAVPLRALWARDVGGPQRPVAFTYPLEDAARRRFFVNARGRDWRVEVTISAGRNFPEPVRHLPNTGSDRLEDFRPLSGTLRFGEMQAVLSVAAVDDANCGAGQVRVFANDAVLLGSVNGRWTPEFNALPADLCAFVQADGDALSLAAAAIEGPVTFIGDAGGTPVTVIGVLREDGYRPQLVFIERDDMTVHANILSLDAVGGMAPRPRGHDVLVLLATPGGPTGDLATLTATREDVWLRPSDLPFALHFPAITLSQNGVGGTYDGVHTFETVRFAPRDLRSNSRFHYSNAFRFRRASLVQPNRQAELRDDGLIADVRFEGGLGQAHFPRTQVIHEPLTARVRGSRLDVGHALGRDAYLFTQSGDCPGCGTEAGNDTTYAVQPEAQAGMSADGATLAAVTNLPDGPGFGPVSRNGDVDMPVFNRFEDGALGGWLQIPGFRAAGTDSEDGDVAAWLLGSREIEQADGIAFPGRAHANDADAQAGNYFFAGITVGPEILRDREGQPQVRAGVDLTRTRMWIGFGGAEAPDWQTVTSNVGTKYVVRRGGLTGVFNADEPPQPQLYGYPTRLDRFAFRVAANAMDTQTWIDGRIDVPGRGGFRLDVLDLDLHCTAQIDGGQMARRDCDRGINCDQSLAAWRAPYDIGGFDFPPQGGALCSPAPRSLRTHGVTAAYALRDPLGLTASWTAAGDPFDERVTAGAHNEVDAGQGADAPGFSVLLHDGVSLDSPDARPDQGWFTFQATTPMPFWDAMATVLRVENAGAGRARQSLMVTADLLDDDGALPDEFEVRTNTELAGSLRDRPDWRPHARYRWGGTDFTLDFPMRYVGRPAPDASPRFEGDSVEGFDLKVLAARAGADWITPERTRVSFGASADFDVIRNAQVDLHLDLNDPESVARADRFIDNALPGDQIGADGEGPIAETLGVMRGAVPALMKATGAGFDDFLEEGLRAALGGLPLQSALTLAADAINIVQGLPARLIKSLLDGPRVLAAQVTARLEARLFASVEVIWQTLPAVVARVDWESPEPADVAALTVVLTEARALLDAFNDAVGYARQLVGSLANIDADITAIEVTIAAEITAAKIKLAALRAALDPVAIGLDTCGIDGGENLLLSKIAEVRDRINQIANGLRTNPLVALAVGLAGAAGVDAATIQAAQTEIQDAALDLQDRAVAAVNTIQARLNSLCAVNAGRLPDVTGAAIDFVDTIDDQLDAIQVTMTTVSPALHLAGEFAVENADGALGDLLAISAGLETLVTQLEAAINDNIPMPLGDTIPDVQVYLDEQLFPGLDGGSFYASVDVNFVAQVRVQVTASVDGLINALIFAIEGAISDAVGTMIVLPTAEELTDILVARIMSSDLVAQIDAVVHDNLAFILDEVDGLTTRLLAQINHLVKAITTGLTEDLNAALSAATAAVTNAIPIQAAEVDGFATIRGDALERLHIDANWTLRGDGEDSSSTYAAAFDMTAWSANGKGANCGLGELAKSTFDAKITAFNLPMSLGGTDTVAKQAFLGFTLKPVSIEGEMVLAPVAVFGGIDIAGSVDFQTFELYDLGLQAGVGQDETYLGAKGSASFDSISMQAAFLLGVTCNTEVLTALDPQAAEFLDIQGAFRGVYLRGGASIPVWDNGCALSVGVSADAGAWLLWEQTGFRVGGLVGGSAWGEALCIAALRGSVTALAESRAGQFRFRGEGFGVAGLGFDCDPGTWTTVARSRRDDWCGTGDAQFGVTYVEGAGFDVTDLDASAIH